MNEYDSNRALVEEKTRYYKAKADYYILLICELKITGCLSNNLACNKGEK